jgi:hypothetical protein
MRFKRHLRRPLAKRLPPSQSTSRWHFRWQRGSVSSTWETKKPHFRGLFLADEGTRTLDLLHGKRVVESSEWAPERFNQAVSGAPALSLNAR